MELGNDARLRACEKGRHNQNGMVWARFAEAPAPQRPGEMEVVVTAYLSCGMSFSEPLLALAPDLSGTRASQPRLRAARGRAEQRSAATWRGAAETRRKQVRDKRPTRRIGAPPCAACGRADLRAEAREAVAAVGSDDVVAELLGMVRRRQADARQGHSRPCVDAAHAADAVARRKGSITSSASKNELCS